MNPKVKTELPKDEKLYDHQRGGSQSDFRPSGIVYPPLFQAGQPHQGAPGGVPHILTFLVIVGLPGQSHISLNKKNSKEFWRRF